ncbi:MULTISPECIES: hypothetical protein [unclassified Aureispira]|uniref:hypothetical protein n=1 Tax=unclassified Aureispira TaxID=2649989 RepID=UPI000696FB50|nr:MULTISPECIES: hypothetical protein [unclassified Aureispira]WMX13090.1 hypothetical protein QP953_19810 [Aureispira sp. CCB-E]
MINFLRFFTIERQFILFIVSLIAIVGLHSWAGFAGSWLPILIVIILVAKHLLIGTVNAAAMKMQQQDFDGAEKLLSYTFKPSWLRFTYHGMYYWIKSTLAFQRKDFKEAERLSNIALGLDLQDDFKAMIYLQLINIYGSRNNRMKVKELYQKAKKLNITQELVKQNIQEVGLMLQGKHAEQKKMMGKKAQRSMMNQSYMRRGRNKRR